MATTSRGAQNESTAEGLRRGLGGFDATMLVAGSMIGSGIFIVSADMARLLGSAGWLLVAWLVTGVLTIAAALSYGELAAMYPRAGGQYVYLREAFGPLPGFLYGWTLFSVIQTGTIAAVAVGFARYLGVLWPSASESRYLVGPWHLTSGYAVSLSTGQAVAIALIALLTFTNTRGLAWGRLIQNAFSTTKIATLLALIAVGLLLGANRGTLQANFSRPFAPVQPQEIVSGLAAASALGLFVALCLSQVGSLFASVAWNNVTFTASEVRRPERNVPLSLAAGTGIVIGLYLLTNLAYLVTLPMGAIQSAPADRVATATLEWIFPGFGVAVMALAIMVSTFGCNNGLVLAGARTFFVMARDGVFFRRVGRLNRAQVPASALVVQGLWASLLVLMRTHDPRTGYGNLYSNLLDYVVSAELLFYALTLLGLIRLRVVKPGLARPYRALGYPVVPLLYVCGAVTLLATLLVYRPATTWPGFVIVVLGVPVYLAWRRRPTSD
jgi:basic amino acid/polyamine antiporter, APA family